MNNQHVRGASIDKPGARDAEPNPWILGVVVVLCYLVGSLLFALALLESWQ